MSLITHALRLLGFSFIATTLLLPVSAVDTYYAATFTKYFFPITVFLIIVFDVITAYFAHKFTHLLTSLIIKSQKNKNKLKRVGERLQSKGRWGMVVFAATPLPYSLAIYTFAAANVPYKAIVIPLVIGRTIKYSVLTILLYWGWY